MKLAAFVVVLGVFAGCKKESTCEKAAARMLECKQIVGNLTAGRDILVFGKMEASQAKQQLVGACDAATEADDKVKKTMECVADASGCDLSACE